MTVLGDVIGFCGMAAFLFVFDRMIRIHQKKVGTLLGQQLELARTVSETLLDIVECERRCTILVDRITAKREPA